MLETYVLHVTKECNLNCTYCYEKDKESQYTWEEVKSLIDDIIKYNKHFRLEFLGGEPCLRIDLIGKTIEYLNLMSDVYVDGFTITTNGTVINDELVSILQNNPNVHWAASIDGNKFMNFMRVTKEGYNSYDLVVNNFKTLNEKLNNDENGQLSCHLVTHPYNIGYFNEGIFDLYEQGFRGFGIGTVESTITIDEEYCREFVNQLKMLSDRIKKGELPGIRIDLFNNLKPRTDGRHYIRDETGKTILETYGRAENDIKDQEGYKTPSASSELGDMIYNIREEVYLYHNQ